MESSACSPSRPFAWFLIAWTWCLAHLMPASGLAQDAPSRWTEPVSLSQVHSGELLCRAADGLFYPLPLLGMDVELEVAEVLNRGRVDQVFFNPSDEVIEAVYVFPLPEGGAVDAMEMRIGDRIIQSVVKEREEAKQTYERAKSEGRKAALVEQERPNLFTTSVANISPGEVVTVHLEYLDELAYEDGSYALAFPLTFTPRYAPAPEWKVQPASHPSSPRWKSDRNKDARTKAEAGAEAEAEARATETETSASGHAGTIEKAGASAGTTWKEEWERVLAPFQGHGSKTSPRATLKAFIRSGTELTNLHSVSHDIDVERVDEGYHVQLREKTVVADRDFLLEWSPQPEDVPAATAFRESSDQGSFLLATIHPATDEAIRDASKHIDTETLFVIDVSGSMDGPSIRQARKALERAVLRLRPSDRFNILWFNHESGFFDTDFVPAEGTHINRARNWIRRLDADGGTEILPAMTRALDFFGEDSSRHRRIVFLTDGAVANELELLEAVQDRRRGVRIHTIGIGHAPNRYLMFELAEEGRGLCELIAGNESVGENLDRFLTRIERPYLEDLSLKGLPEGASVYPSVLPDLYEGEPLHVSIRLKDNAPLTGPIEVTGSLAGRPWSQELVVTGAPERAGIGTRWARNRIGEAMTTARRAGNRDGAKTEVTQLGLAFSIVTPFTSLVAVEKVATAVGPSQRAPVPNALPAGSTLGSRVGGTLPQGGTPEPLLRILALFCLLSGTSLVAWIWRTR